MSKHFQGLSYVSAYSLFGGLARASPQITADVTAGASDQKTVQTLQENGFQSCALQPHLSRYHRLREVERKIRRTLDLSTIFGTTVVEAATLFAAHQVVLIQFDSKLGHCHQISRYCQNQSLAWQPPFTFPQTDFPSLRAQLWQGQPIYLSNVNGPNANGPNVNGSNANGLTSEPMRSHLTLSRDIQTWQSRWPGNWLMIPIPSSVEYSGSASGSVTSSAVTSSAVTSSAIASNKIIPTLDSRYWGIFALALATDQDCTEAMLSDIQSIVLELSAAMAHSFQYQELLTTNTELQKLALSDGLTSLANRRRFDKYIEDEWQRLAREQQPLSLILCDIDHFKLFNDTFGHPAGDRCLIHIARALLKVPQRPADLVARYGGEEFAIVLPNTDTQGAWRIAQNIHASIQTLRIAHAASSTEPYVTVTMGVSTVTPGHTVTPKTLIRASDIALYYAKQQGRNRTYVNGHHNTVNLADCALKAEASPEYRLKLTPNE